jgi:ubiquinone/menaquinone biosynthesis C-methylase UbiE
MNDGNHHACPVEKAGLLDNGFRRWFQSPRKTLKPYLREGMTVLDMGCGPGFFSIDMAGMVGKSGRVIASDLQAGMLQKLKGKIQGTELEERITLHQCQPDKIGLLEKVDFVLAAWMVHEVPDQERFFQELGALLKPGGQILILEPPFHVSKKEFEKMIEIARGAGFLVVKKPKSLLGKTVVLKKSG